jgi:hypothetical protein
VTPQSHQAGLIGATANWSTPQARDHMPPHSPERVAAMKAEGHGMRNLNDEAAMWRTPAANNGERGGMDAETRIEAGHQPNLQDQAVSFLPAPQTLPDGGKPSPERRSLNPLFVEWLMGWPPGWTLLALPGSTGSACSETALCLWKARMRSALSSLASPEEAPPAQIDFWG